MKRKMTQGLTVKCWDQAEQQEEHAILKFKSQSLSGSNIDYNYPKTIEKETSSGG
jgi:hypothetical protein